MSDQHVDALKRQISDLQSRLAAREAEVKSLRVRDEHPVVQSAVRNGLSLQAARDLRVATRGEFGGTSERPTYRGAPVRNLDEAVALAIEERPHFAPARKRVPSLEEAWPKDINGVKISMSELTDDQRVQLAAIYTPGVAGAPSYSEAELEAMTPAERDVARAAMAPPTMTAAELEAERKAFEHLESEADARQRLREEAHARQKEAFPQQQNRKAYG